MSCALSSIMDNNNGNTQAKAQKGLDHVKDTVRGLVDQGQEKVSAFKDKVVDIKDQTMSKGSVYLDKTTDFIKANPIKAVAIAFGAGYLGMRLFRR